MPSIHKPDRPPTSRLPIYSNKAPLTVSPQCHAYDEEKADVYDLIRVELRRSVSQRLGGELP